MLISDKLTRQMNEQVGHEFGAMLQYVQIASYFDREGLPALSKHFFRQANEEREHAMKFVRFLNDADVKVAIPVIPAPRADFDSAEEAVRLSHDWEMTVTRQINALMDQAIKDNDHISKQFLDWFMQEQLEEVSSMGTLLSMVRRAGEKGLLFVEQYLMRGGAPGDGAGAEDDD